MATQGQSTFTARALSPCPGMCGVVVNVSLWRPLYVLKPNHLSSDAEVPEVEAEAEEPQHNAAVSAAGSPVVAATPPPKRQRLTPPSARARQLAVAAVPGGGSSARASVAAVPR